MDRINSLFRMPIFDPEYNAHIYPLTPVPGTHIGVNT